MVDSSSERSRAARLKIRAIKVKAALRISRGYQDAETRAAVLRPKADAPYQKVPAARLAASSMIFALRALGPRDLA